MDIYFKNNNFILKATRGIYFLFDKDEIVYIGQSNFIEKRIFEHTNDKSFTSWNFIEFNSNEDLNDLEADYILKHKPKYNKTIPPNNIWISRSILSRFYNVPMLKTRRLIKSKEIEYISFKNTEYIKWGQL